MASLDPVRRALRLARSAIIISLVSGAVLGAILAALGLTEAGGSFFTRDLASTGDLPPWAGAVSLLALVVWGGAAGACVVGGVVARRHRHPAASFLLATAALLILLAIDDALQFHEDIGPTYVGMPELAVYAVMALAAMAWSIVFRRRILESAWPMLVMAGAWFAGSLALDIASRGPAAFEDWFKYSGLITLAAWCLGESTRVVTEVQPLRNGPEIS